MGNFGVAQLSDDLRRQLGQGEVALAYENATMRGAADRAGKTQAPRMITGFSWPTPLNVLGGATGFESDDDYAAARLSGIGVEGGVGARGHQIASTIGELAHLLLTTQRLTVVKSGRIRLSVPIQELVSVARAPRILQVGRLEFAFRDGSVVRPTLAMVIPRASDRFMRAVETGMPQS